MRERQLRLEGLHNIRDLGGLTLPEGGVTRFGSVLRGCSMRELTPRGRAALAAHEFAMVIDLRSDRERETHPTWITAAPGVTTLHVPLFAGLSPVYKMANSSRGFSLVERYAAALDQAGPHFAQAIRAVAEAPKGAVLIHCTAGKDRTGLLAALLLSLAGVPKPEIVADYHMSVTEGRPYIERLKRSSQARKTAPRLLERMLDAPPAVMEETLSLLEHRHGGARAYLTAAGLSAETAEAAARRLKG